MAAFSSDGQRCIEQQVGPINVSPTPLNELRSAYELDRCDSWIQTNHYSKVCLQFPDELLCDAPDIVLILQNSSGAHCYILGDTSYGSCCVDEVSAEHVQCDGIIHFGHACLSPTRRLPVLYIFPKNPFDVERLCSAVNATFKDRKSKLLFIYDVTYAHKIDEVYDTLSCLYPNLVTAYPNVSSCHTKEGKEQQQVCLGSRFCIPEGTSLDDYNVLFIGKDGRTFTNYLLEFGDCKIFRYDPDEPVSVIEAADGKISKFLMKRLHLVERVKDAKTLGILIGTLGVDGYLDAVDQIKNLAKKAGKKTYIFAVGRPNIPKLANFPEIDVFVLVACPENSLLDWKDFYQPVVSLYEVELACNTLRQWSTKYVSDFRQLLLGGKDHVQLPEISMENFSDVSLITGKVRNVDITNIASAESDSSNRSITDRGDLTVCLSTGSEFLVNRTWQGLEQNLGQNPVELATLGRSGIASSYHSEPVQRDAD
ncbi:2-(3-amino-3-carboxypropyl)histidine synthase subunit 2 isoform X2 [Thrips palmi]|uniref:2-(3-amino-3-carboxypropyl)histidine synthase subunit 2 n=1 Tax=Thrips palmi TaxID=161013 RepID=A0A6P9A8L0_THRPL|nr:2-(3-amino-3-carboxypropyl)histidine synthase subunit 2 isoform X2 [Thrips palmi]